MAAQKAMIPRDFIKQAGGPKSGGAYLIYGHEEYIKAETARQAVEAHVPATERTFSVTHLIAGQTDASEILAAAQAIPLLGTRTAVVVHDAHKLAATHKTRLTPALASIGPPTLLILMGPDELDRRTKFYKWFADNNRNVLCDPLDERQAEQYAKREIRKVDKKITAEALARLLAYAGPDAGILSQECEKLALFVGDREEITDTDVDTVTGQSRGSDVNEWVTTQLQQDAIRALAIARRLLATGNDPATLVGRLAMHYFDLYRTLLSGERNPWKLAGNIRVPIARAEQLMAWARLCDRRAVGDAVAHIADADALVKSGRVDPVPMLDALALALAGGNIPAPSAIKKKKALP